jgi:RNA polymerase sigma factor for flagellar operon FliA
MYTAKGQLDVNSMLKQYSSLVRRLAHQMIAKLPANVEIDDLIQVGMIGLTDALSRFDAAQGVQFETFATQRIRGAMLDELRGNDYLSRGTRKQQRSIESAVHKLEQKLGRAPAESEIAREMGITLTEYQELLGKVRGTQLVYLEDMSATKATTTTSTATSPTKASTRSRSCRTSACARRWSRRSRRCPSASST